MVGDISTSPIPDFWCGWTMLLEPDLVTADPPPPWGFAARQTIEQLGGVLIEQRRVSLEPLTISEATTVGRSMEAAHRAWMALYSDVSRSSPANQYGDVLQRARSVSNTVTRTTTPVVLTASIAAVCALGAAAVMLARAKRHELLLVAVRGLSPIRIATSRCKPLLLVLAAASGIGFVAAWAAVKAVGPSPTLEPNVVAACCDLHGRSHARVGRLCRWSDRVPG